MTVTSTTGDTASKHINDAQTYTQDKSKAIAQGVVDALTGFLEETLKDHSASIDWTVDMYNATWPCVTLLVRRSNSKMLKDRLVITVPVKFAEDCASDTLKFDELEQFVKSCLEHDFAFGKAVTFGFSQLRDEQKA